MDALLIDAVRTPFGRYRGGLSGIRTDDLAAAPIGELLRRHPDLDPAAVDDVLLGNTNGAGEENRNVGRMAALLAGLPVSVPGATVNRLCASGGEAIVQGARAVAAGDARLVIAGGVEGMSRAPYVVPKPDEALPRTMEMVQTTVGWRLVNPAFPPQWTDPLGVCAERVAAELGIGRAGAGRVGAAQPRTRSGCVGQGAARRLRGGARRRRTRRVHPARHQPGPAGRVAAGVQRRRDRHRRQLLPAQRRCDRLPARVGRGRGRAGCHPARPVARQRHRRRGAGPLHARAGPGDREGAGPRRPHRRRHRRLGDQRGVRGDGAVLPARAAGRSTSSGSTRTAARSRSAIRWVRRRRG